MGEKDASMRTMRLFPCLCQAYKIARVMGKQYALRRSRIGKLLLIRDTEIARVSGRETIKPVLGEDNSERHGDGFIEIELHRGGFVCKAGSRRSCSAISRSIAWRWS